MPFKEVYVEPELFVEHRGVRVFRVYKENNYEHPLSFWYTTKPLTEEQEEFDRITQETFDVRKLPNARMEYLTGDLGRIREIIKEAIDLEYIEGEE